MKARKAMQIISLKWMENISEAEIVFEKFSLCMDLW